MDRQDVVSLVIDAVKQVQEASGRTVGNIGPLTRPLQEIDWFDSYCGVEASLFISESLGCEIPCEVFLPAEGRRHLSIGEVADRVSGQMRLGAKEGG